jgi:hypothetical protein
MVQQSRRTSFTAGVAAMVEHGWIVVEAPQKENPQMVKIQQLENA